MTEKTINGYLGFGDIDLTPFATLDGAENQGEYTITYGKDMMHLSASNGIYRDDIYLKQNERGFTARRTFKNLTDKPLKLNEIGIRLTGVDFGNDPTKDYYYHVETPRVYQRMTLSVDHNRKKGGAECPFDEFGGNRWADPGVITDRIGACPYQPFPAILVSNYGVKDGLVHGTLSQKVFYHCYLLTHREQGLVMDIYSAFKDISYRIVESGEILVDEWYLGRTNRANELEHLFDDYCTELRRVLPANHGASDVNRYTLVWGTWNDGIGRKINEQMILEEADALVKYFPNVEWLQIDDGYSAEMKTIAHGLGLPYEGEEGVDSEKFPRGMRYVSDEIRKRGLRPAIWIGGYCPMDSRISRERPDLMFHYRSKKNYTLDISNDETREYMLRALDTLILEWGFEGVKHDFWSYAFEVSEDLLKNKHRSGYEWRHFWLDEIRKRISPNGHFQTGCDIVMANPFLGESFTNYRYGIDISSGNFDYIRTNFLWCAACLATHTGDLFVPNSDAVGLLPGLNDVDMEFCVNFVLITRTMVELAGKFSKIDPSDRRFRILRKATCNINNGQDVFFAGYDYRTAASNGPPKIYIKTPHFSKEQSPIMPQRTLALFNPDDEAKTVTVRSSELDLPDGSYLLTDVWTGEEYTLKGDLEFDLPPHKSYLLSVTDEYALMTDANIEIIDPSFADGVLTFRTPYYATAEIRFNSAPKQVLCNGCEVAFTTENRNTVFGVEKNSRVEIRF